MTVESLTLDEHVAPRRKRNEGASKNFEDGVDESFVVTRLMTLDWREDWGQDVVRAALPRQEHFNACARGLRRFDEDELVLMRNDHRWFWRVRDDVQRV